MSIRKFGEWAVLAAGLLVFPVAAEPLSAAAEAVQSTTEFSAEVVNSCTGEAVGLTGELHSVTRVTMDQGGVHVLLHFNAQNVHGVSMEGRVYRATRNIALVVNGDGVPYSTTAVQSFNLVSKGSAPNFLVHVTSHITVNAGGETTVEVVNVSPECGN
jgi:hypothetical protein